MLFIGNCIISYYFIISYGKNDSRDLDLASLFFGKVGV